MRSANLACCALVVATAVACERGGLESFVPTPTTTTAPVGAPYFIDPNATGPVAGARITVDFGGVRLGTEVRREVLVGNRGAATFTVTGIERSAAFPDAFGVAPSSFSVDGGRYYSLVIAFRPVAAGPVPGSLRLVIENGDPAELAVDLLGTGTESTSPELDVAPTQSDFGEVGVGTLKARRLVVMNVGSDVQGTGDDNLRFGAMGEGGVWEEKVPEVVGPDAAEFTLEWPPQDFDAVAGLAEGEAAELRVMFQPIREGKHSATLVIYSNDPRHGRVEIPLSGTGGVATPCDFTVKPPSLSFGSVEANRSLTLSFTFINIDPDPSHECLLSALDLSPATKQTGAFALVDGPIIDATVRGGGSLVVPVRFQPRSAGTFGGELSFFISNPMHPEVTVPIYGAAHTVCLMVAPREVDFGSVNVNCNSRQRIFTMYNTCTGAVQIDAIDMQQGPSNEFAITNKPALPVSIAGGASADFKVTYHPVEVGEDTAVAGVVMHGGDGPLLVTLAGNGQPGETQTDVFSQSARPKLDLLLVIDNSATMADKQASLATNLSTLFASAARSCIDYHIAITTTDVSASGEAGRFVPIGGGNPRVVTRTTPNAQQVLAQNAAVGTSGSETESLLSPAYLALTDPLLTGHNAGFYRDGAALAVLIISDAADQDAQLSVSDYYNFFIGLKGVRRRNDVAVTAVIPTQTQAPSGCSYDTPNAASNSRVSQLVQQTGGILEDICDPNWGGRFSLYCSYWSQRTTFFLSRRPDMSVADPIQVSIDGVPFSQFDAHGARRWDFNTASNAVEFDPLAVPEPGSALTITYHVACE